MILNRPRIAVFDVEGTLVDCVPAVLESWRETLQEAGYSFSHRDLQPYSGMDGAWMLEQLLPQEREATRKRLLELQGERYRNAFIERARPFPQVRDLFETLKTAGVTIGIATTCKSDEFAIYEKKLQVRDLVDAVVCGESAQHGKPDPGLFRQSLHRLQVADPSSAIAVGDTPFDALAARAANVRAVGVLTGGFSGESLLDAGCEFIFDQACLVRRLWYTNGTPGARDQGADDFTRG